jgi:DNA primase
VRLPAGSDPADVVQRDGADAMRALLERSVPYARFEVERALERGETRSAEGRDRVLETAAAAIRPLPPSVLRDELVQLVAGRLELTESLVASALAGRPGAWRDQAAGAGARRDSAPPAGRAGELRDSAPGTWRNRTPGGSGDPGPEAAANGARAVLARREQTERAFLALCLALPDEGEARLAAADFDELFSSPSTRRAADYLRGRLRSPAGDLPAGDEPLARLVAELVIRAGQLDATPAKLELEALQLHLHSLDRRIATARTRGGEGMHALASERQKVLDEIRHRLS